jgi:hypothetical protein
MMVQLIREIAAENTNIILDQTCNAITQTQSLEDTTNARFNDVDAKLDQANAKLEKANAKLDQANGKLDDLLCPFGPRGATFTSLRLGCDTVDQNCNGVVDECAEDKVPPSLTLRTPIPEKSFKSTDEARQSLQENILHPMIVPQNFKLRFSYRMDQTAVPANSESQLPTCVVSTKILRAVQQ